MTFKYQSDKVIKSLLVHIFESQLPLPVRPPLMVHVSSFYYESLFVLERRLSRRELSLSWINAIITPLRGSYSKQPTPPDLMRLYIV